MTDTPKLNTYAMAFVFQSGAIVMHACCAVNEAAACALGGVAAGRAAEGELAGCQVMPLTEEWMRASLRLAETGKSGDVVSLVSDNLRPAPAQTPPPGYASVWAGNLPPGWPLSYVQPHRPSEQDDPA